MAFIPIDPKRDEFRRYLERSGVIDALGKVFAALITEKERPSDPIEYFRNRLSAGREPAQTVADLQDELEEARKQIQQLREIIQRVDPLALADAPTPPLTPSLLTAVEAAEGGTIENITVPAPLPNSTPATKTAAVVAVEEDHAQETPDNFEQDKELAASNDSATVIVEPPAARS